VYNNKECQIVIWLLNRLGLCLKEILGLHFRIYVPGRQVVTLRPCVCFVV